MHGIAAPASTLLPFLTARADAGFNVLAYDAYGRGYSDTPSVPYTSHLYTHQLRMLLDHVGWSRCLVLGYSLGGAVAACFATEFPDMVSRLVLVAPAGLMPSLPLIANIVTLPVVGELLVHTV